MPKFRFSVSLLLLAATGCAVGPNYTRPDTKVPDAWHAPSSGGEKNAPVDLAKWWEVFGDAKLNTLIDEATKSNFDLQIAESRVREARAARGIVAADLYPQVGVAGSYSRNQTAAPDINDSPSLTLGGSANPYTFSKSASLRAGNISATTSSSITRLSALLQGAASGQTGGGGATQGGSLLNPFRNNSISFTPGGSSGFDRTQDFYQAGFDASWELDVFGGNRRAVEAANADINAAEENQRDVLVSLLAEVARNYLTLREAQTRLQIAAENISAQQETANITRSRYDAGLTSEFDVTRAEAQLATTQSQIPAIEVVVLSTIHRLSVLLGKNPADLYDELIGSAPLPPTPPEVPVGMPSDLLRRRADVRRAERQLAAATARIGVATADLFPKFSLTGNFGVQSNKFSNLTVGANQIWGIGPGISWPVFDAGRIRANIKVQDARQEQALAFYEKAVKESLEDTENSLVAFAKEQERLVLLNKAVASEKQSVSIANERYVKGLSDFVNVLDAQRTLYSAQDEQVQSQTTVLLNLVSLYKALGGGWEWFEPPIEETTPTTPTGQG